MSGIALVVPRISLTDPLATREIAVFLKVLLLLMKKKPLR